MGHKSQFALLRKCKNCKSLRLFHVPLFSYEILRINVYMNSAINLGLEKVIRPKFYKNGETAKMGRSLTPSKYIHSTGSGSIQLAAIMLGLKMPTGRSIACSNRYFSPRAFVRQQVFGRSPIKASVIAPIASASIHLRWICSSWRRIC